MVEDGHDTPRLLTVLTGAEIPESLEAQANYVFSPEQTARARALVRLATVLQFTLPGVPCVYYGDEAGLDGFGDPFCRKCYPWGQEDGELMKELMSPAEVLTCAVILAFSMEVSLEPFSFSAFANAVSRRVASSPLLKLSMSS